MFITLINPSTGYGDKTVPVIKAIRMVSGVGLKEAKDAAETNGRVNLPVNKDYDKKSGMIKFTDFNGNLVTYPMEDSLRIIRNAGGRIGGVIHEILQEMRNLAARALEAGEDEFANEMMQMIFAEKLKRNENEL